MDTLSPTTISLTRDRAEILGLWSRNLPEASPERFEWLYGSGRAEAWKVRAEDGRTMGSVGLMARMMDVLGELLPTAQPIDLNVDLAFRTGGPAIRLQRTATEAAERRGCRLLYALPNARSEPVLRRVGYRELGPVQRWVKLLRAEEFFANCSRLWLSPATARVASLPASLAMMLASRETYRRLPAGMTVETTDGFDGRFDALWHRLRGQFPICGERTADYLTWRFGQSPEGPQRAFCLSDSRGQLLAYLVYLCREGKVYVNDLLFDSRGSLDALLAQFLRAMRRAKMQTVTVVYLGASTVSDVVDSMGFWRRPSPWKALVCADTEYFGPDTSRLLDPENWHLTRADIDTDI